MYMYVCFKRPPLSLYLCRTNLLIPNNSSRLTTAVVSGSIQYALNTNGVSNYVTGWLIVNILRTITLTLSWVILGWVQNADRLKGITTLKCK